MRDDTKRWPPARDPGEAFTAPGLSMHTVKTARLTLLSGPRALHSTGLPLVEWPHPIDANSYAITLRRDRVMEVDGPERMDGWEAKTSLAVSDVTDAYTTVEIVGENAFSLLRRGTEIDLNTPSRSAARLLFGLGTILYRYQAEDRFRIHAASGQDEALWHALKDAAQHLF